MWRRHWRIAVVVGVQLLILAAIPAKKVLALRQGVEVTLRTMPVDPYDLLSGYYVILGYEAEQVRHGLRPPPGEGDTVYVTVERGPVEWRATGVTREPVKATPDRRSILARWSNGRPQLDGVGRFYIPETERVEVEEAMRSVEGRALVDMRVDTDGTAALVRLRVGDRAWGK